MGNNAVSVTAVGAINKSVGVTYLLGFSVYFKEYVQIQNILNVFRQKRRLAGVAAAPSMLRGYIHEIEI